MLTPPPAPPPDCRAYLLIELLADGSLNIYMHGDYAQLWAYLIAAKETMPPQAPREAA
jgi:hypothetical protein